MSTKRIISLSFTEKTLRTTERIYLSVFSEVLSVTKNLENLTVLPHRGLNLQPEYAEILLYR
jgi:hypothetical protein